MSRARPTVDEERWLVLAARYPALRAAVEAGGHTGGWRAASLPSRCLFFALGLFGASLVGGFLAFTPEPALVGGLVLVALAEWMIRARRAINSGIEEAGWLAGAGALGFELLSATSMDPGIAVALAALTLALLGVRLLNPLFLAAGVLLAPLVFVAADFGASWRVASLAAAFAYAVIGLAALVVGARPWQRPSFARAVDVMLVAAPLATYVCWEIAGRPAAWALPAALGAAGLGVGLIRRWQAAVWAALGAAACGLHAAWQAMVLAPYWKLILFGAAVLAGALVAERVLRRPRDGITSRRAAAEAGVPEVLEAAVAARLGAGAAEAPPAATPGVQGQGGGFGGGGATGRF